MAAGQLGLTMPSSVSRTVEVLVTVALLAVSGRPQVEEGWCWALRQEREPAAERIQSRNGHPTTGEDQLLASRDTSRAASFGPTWNPLHTCLLECIIARAAGGSAPRPAVRPAVRERQASPSPPRSAPTSPSRHAPHLRYAFTYHPGRLRPTRANVGAPRGGTVGTGDQAACPQVDMVGHH